MIPVYRIHPSIGIARLGNSPDGFCIGPDKPAALPIDCDPEGNPRLTPDGKSELEVSSFKDPEGRITRQAARFRVYVYDDESPEGRPLKIGDPIEGGGNHGKLIDIEWRVHLANKKAAWYEFDGLKGEHGYAKDHPLRNADITDDNARQQLIIDPGPRFVNVTDRRRAAFDRSGNQVYSAVFPPKGLSPEGIDTLGDLLTDDWGRLLVLGGHGHSGSSETGLGQPRIDAYANNDGWFDDTSDGPVMARLVMYSDEVTSVRCIDAEYPAWVISGYPRYVPEILDMVTLDDVVYDLAVRRFGYRTDIYGVPGTYNEVPKIDRNDEGALAHWNAGPLDWNPDFKPWFYRDIWPILFRPDEMQYLNNILLQSNAPHNQTQRGNFDPTKLSVPPLISRLVLEERKRAALERNQSGELFVEELELQLHIFDDAIDQALRRKLRETPEVKDSGIPVDRQLRVARAAVRNTAGEGHDHFDEAALRKAAMRFAEAAAASPGNGAAYDHAKNRFKEEVCAALEPFIQAAIRRWSGGMPHGSALVALFQQSETGSGDDVIERVVRAAVNDLSNTAMTNFRDGHDLDLEFAKAVGAATNDPYRDLRMYLYRLLRRPGEENVFKTAGKPENRLFRLPLMPLLAGDNPGSNNLPSKFLRLTDYQLFLLRQWAEGMFFNEIDEGWVPDTAVDPWLPYRHLVGDSARDLDRGVLMNMLGGAFYPGGEVCWVIRNPSVYKEPYRLRADPEFYNFGQTAANQSKTRVTEQQYLGNAENPLSQRSDFDTGLQPGDLTKYSALPWQADFNECTTQSIDITYELWNSVDYTSEGDGWLKREQKTWEAMWWPAHRPLQTYERILDSSGKAGFEFLGWSRGVTQTYAGDLKMVTEWARLGFVVRNPYVPANSLDGPSPDVKYVSVERNQDRDLQES